jgi:hypothetical protein
MRMRPKAIEIPISHVKENEVGDTLPWYAWGWEMGIRDPSYLYLVCQNVTSERHEKNYV